MTFSTRELWAGHEFSEHRVEKVWHHTECPLCLTFVALTRGAFAIHVAKHMEKIALTALPPEMDFDTESEAELSEKDTYNACSKDGIEGITDQLEVASDPDTVNPVESAQQGGDRLGTKHLIHCDAQEQSTLGTELVELQPRYQHDRSPTPPPPSMYQEHPQDSYRGGPPQRKRFIKLTSACARCRMRKVSHPCHVLPLPCSETWQFQTRCFGFEASEDGRCRPCQRSQQACIFTPVSSQWQASVAPHTTYSEFQSTGPSKGEYPSNIAVLGSHISCSIFVLQTRTPEKWLKLPDFSILQSLAAMFECMKLQSQFNNVDLLKLTLRSAAMEEVYLLKRNDNQKLRQINCNIKREGNGQLQMSKNKKDDVQLLIECVGADEISPDYVAEENEDQAFLVSLPSPQPSLSWNSATPHTDILVTPQGNEVCPSEGYSLEAVKKKPKSEVSWDNVEEEFNLCDYWLGWQPSIFHPCLLAHLAFFSSVWKNNTYRHLTSSTVQPIHQSTDSAPI